MACSQFSPSIVALQEVLRDCSFKTGSKEALNALEEAKCSTIISEFTEALLIDLRNTFIGSEPSGKYPLNREKLWRAVFHLRSSSSFISRWQNVLQRVGATSTPVLYQHFTDLTYTKEVDLWVLCNHSHTGVTYIIYWCCFREWN